MLLLKNTMKDKKFYVILGLALVFVAGFVLGAVLLAYGVQKNKDVVCAVVPSLARIPFSVLDDISSLKPDQTIFGIVISISPSELVLRVKVRNPFNELEESKVLDVKVPVGQNDKVLRFAFENENSSNLVETQSSLSEGRVGDYVAVKVLSDGSKLIYLPISL